MIKLLFMGTPDFAAASLKALYETGKYDIEVVTQPDRPKGRGNVLTPPDVKVFALEHGLNVYQPETFRDGAFREELARINPDIAVVAAYGKILPQYVLDCPKYGCINIHGSLLPKYRGAAPMQRAIINGETRTGITIMKMDAGLDTGDMLLKYELEIAPDDTFEDLFEKMARAGAKSIVSALPMIIDGTLVPEKQDGSLSSYAAKIEKEDCVIDFSKSASDVYNHIRGLSPVPLAFTFRADGTQIKIVSARLSEKIQSLPCGSAVENGGLIDVVCGDGKAVSILSLIPAGRKKMTSAEYLRGHRLTDGEKFGG
ncbi:MAG: methionyl-tRNA formyltransferase [Clostridia bacterium]|nr:methionyl-tRNA formyltransferase [Clostridia bacterium]